MVRVQFGTAVAVATGGAVFGVVGTLLSVKDLSTPSFQSPKPFPVDHIPTRQEALTQFQQHSTPDKPYDILVIGGGATGSGVALDAATRGFNVALIEGEDFGAGTSSKSTKLLHGGVRYLEKAVLRLDKAQYKMVCEGLSERSVVLHQAPHLCTPLPTILPCYGPFDQTWYWLGMKAYDLVAAINQGTLEFSRLVTTKETLELLPNLSTSRNSDKIPLKGSLMYYEGQMNDSRLNVAVAQTAARFGAAVANHCQLKKLETSQLFEDKPSGESKKPPIKAVVYDTISQKEITVYANCIINATGPFVDSVLQSTYLKSGKQMVQHSTGAHVVLPAKYAGKTGMIIPKTKDGRVIFILPWEGKTIAGTTDVPIKPNPTIDPVPTVSEIDFILDSIEDYLKVKIPEKEVLSVWTGLRPLALPSGPLRVDSTVSNVRDNFMVRIAKLDPRIWRPDDKSDSKPLDDAPQSVTPTAEVVREHAIHIEPAANIITVVGGKWTTYRKMAADVVNLAVAQLKYTDMLPPAVGGPSSSTGKGTTSDQKIAVDPNILLQADNTVTRNLVLVGGEGLHTEKAKTELKAKLQSTSQISDDEVLGHLCKHYGTEASTLVKEYLVAQEGGASKPASKTSVEANRKRLHPEYPILEGEVRYCAKYEQAVLPQDFVSRRARLSFLDVNAAQQVLPRVTEILAEENGWNKAQKEQALADARKHLSTFYVPGTAPTWTTTATAAGAVAATEVKKGKPWWKFW